MNVYVASDNLIWLLGLKDELTDNYVDAATVSATVYLGTTLIATVPMSYVAGPQTANGVTYEDGCYVGQLAANAGLVAGATYVVTIVATSGGNTLTKELTVAGEYDGVQ